MIESGGFLLVALATFVSAVCTVRSENMIRAVLWLALTLLGTAVIYAMLGAAFLAGVQVLTYIGGVVTLLIFGVMVTRRHEGAEVPAGHVFPERGLLVSGGLFLVLALATLKTDLPTAAPSVRSTAQLGKSLLGEHLIAFEAASLLLLAAIVGAVVIARRRDPDPQTGREPSALPLPTAATEVRP